MNSERGINRRAASNDRMCDTNVSIGDVKAIPLNVVQAIIRLHAKEVEHIGQILRDLGVAPDSFSWTPTDDGPYPGLRPLKEGDAALFFGRRIEIRDGLKALEELRESVSQRAFLIQAPSGAGK